MEQNKLSITYKILRTFGFNYSEEEYGQVGMMDVFLKFFGNIYRKRLEKMMDWPILQSFNPRRIRPILMRQMGCKVGKECFIGDYVRVDCGHANMITLEDHVSIASGT